MNQLTADLVRSTFVDCLFRDGEDTSNYVSVPGIVTNVGFHPDRLRSHKAVIDAMLDELPEQFHEGHGDGWSFLQACNDRHGRQWGEHHDMEQLFQLGIGIGRVTCPLPRELWSALPGGMPYYCIALAEVKL